MSAWITSLASGQDRTSGDFLCWQIQTQKLTFFLINMIIKLLPSVCFLHVILFTRLLHNGIFRRTHRRKTALNFVVLLYNDNKEFYSILHYAESETVLSVSVKSAFRIVNAVSCLLQIRSGVRGAEASLLALCPTPDCDWICTCESLKDLINPRLRCLKVRKQNAESSEVHNVNKMARNGSCFAVVYCQKWMHIICFFFLQLIDLLLCSCCLIWNGNEVT